MLTNKYKIFSIDEVEVDENKQVALIEPVSEGKFFLIGDIVLRKISIIKSFLFAIKLITFVNRH